MKKLIKVVIPGGEALVVKSDGGITPFNRLNFSKISHLRPESIKWFVYPLLLNINDSATQETKFWLKGRNTDIKTK